MTKSEKGQSGSRRVSVLGISSLVLAAIAIVISIFAFFGQRESNKLAKEAIETSRSFNVINAEVQWNALLDAYNEIDDSLRHWEEGNKMTRNGTAVESLEDLEKHLDKRKMPPEIIRLYTIRQNKYISLKNVAAQYAPFQERLTDLDLRLPSPPVLPKGGVHLRGVHVGGAKIG